MNLGIEHLMLFIWVIGWLIGCGKHHNACKAGKYKEHPEYYAVMFFFWPFYLGY